MMIIEVNDKGELVSPSDRKLLAGEMPGVRTFVLFIHGWMTSDADEMDHAKAIEANLLPALKGKVLAACLRWPSQWTGCDLLNLTTFYSDEALSDLVGAHAGCDLIETAMENADGPLHVVVIGHSFGCRAACAGIANATDKFSVSCKAILLQGAFAASDLNPGQRYGRLARMPVEILATTSAGDTALKDGWKFADMGGVALGYGGPTQVSQDAYGSRLRTIDILPWQEADLSDSIDRHSQVWTLASLWQAEADFINQNSWLVSRSLSSPFYSLPR